jgi:hypothetical protein
LPTADRTNDRATEALAMIGYVLSAGLRGVIVVALVILVLGLVALVRCRKEDIPAIVRAMASWWRRS